MKYYRTKLLAALAVVLTLWCGQTYAATRVYNLVNYGIRPDDTAQNTATKLSQAVRQIAAGQRAADTLHLVLAKGTYYFDLEGSPSKQVYISNHDQLDRPRHFGLLLEGLRNIRIEGGGAQFVFRSQMLPVGIIGCSNISLRGIGIDFAEPTIGQVTILENKGAEGMVFAPHHAFALDKGRYEIIGRNGRQEWRVAPGAGIATDLNGMMRTQISDLTIDLRQARALPQSADGQVRIHAPLWQDARLDGQTMVILRSYYRPHPGIFIDDSRDTHLQDIWIGYADGMGLLAQNSHNVRLRSFHVTTDNPHGKDSGRIFTTQADATHFSGCSGLIDVQQCSFEAMMDDAINVHGVYLRLSRRLDNRTIVAQYMHDQAWGMQWGKPGDTIQFVQSRTFDVIDQKYVIASIKPHDRASVAGAKEFEIRLTRPLPPEVKDGASIGVENLSKTPAVIFSHNRVCNNRARGILINTPEAVQVEYNVFDNVSGSAILVSSDCNIWYESGRTRNMLIRGNQFIDVLKSLYQFTSAVISIYPVIPELERQGTPFYGNGADGIRVVDNLFMTFDTPLLFARSVDGLLWRGNTVIETKNFAKFHPNQKPFLLEGSRNVRIEE